MDDNNEVKFNEWKPPQEWVRGKSKSGFGEKLVNLIIKISGGLVKDERQANYVMATLILLMIIFSIFIFYSSISEEKLPKIQEDQIL